MGNIKRFLPKWHEDSPEAENQLFLLLTRPTRSRRDPAKAAARDVPYKTLGR
jgi:hypothetical protein